MTGKINAVQTTLRTVYAPNLDVDEVPAFVHVTSVHNITVERQWQPLFKDVLANILEFWYKHDGQYHSEDLLHQSVARFLWAKIVQIRLDEHERLHANHRIRKQRGRLLPTGGKPSQFYRNPEQWGGSPCLIPIPPEDIEDLVSRYVPVDLFHFCEPAIHEAATFALTQIGDPRLAPDSGWAVFGLILPRVKQLLGLEEVPSSA